MHNRMTHKNINYYKKNMNNNVVDFTILKFFYIKTRFQKELSSPNNLKNT